jgi:Zn-dependent peptidase ImmA (M78 family)
MTMNLIAFLERTDEKIEQLKKRFHLEPAIRIANDLGFSREEIYIKARQLRLKKKSVVWSESELQYLENNFKIKPIQEICKVLKRTEAAVNLRAFVLGLKPKRRRSKLKKITAKKPAQKRSSYVSIIPEELKNIRMYG